MTKTRILRLSAMWTLLAAIFCLPAVMVKAEMYKWVDKNGDVHYTQDPPDEGVKTSVVDEPDPRADPGPKITNTGYPQAPTSTTAKNPASAKEKQKEENASRCKIARKNIAMLQRSNNVVRKKVGDKVVVVNNDERDNLIKSQQALIDQYCS